MLSEEKVVGLLRKRLKSVTLRSLAEEFGVSHGFLSDVLSGKRHPSPNLLDKLGLERVVSFRYKTKRTA